MSTVVYLSLGSNLGDRAEHLRRALEAVATLPDTRLVAQSSVHETVPWGVTDQPSFLNLAAAIETALGPLELLAAVKEIEGRLGRMPGPHWGPRVIDIDLVLWQDTVVESDALTLPHPRFRERAFVLLPLREIAPGAVDPVTGHTVDELAAALDDS